MRTHFGKGERIHTTVSRKPERQPIGPNLHHIAILQAAVGDGSSVDEGSRGGLVVFQFVAAVGQLADGGVDATDGQVFETYAIYHDRRPNGWRGDIVLYSVETGKLHWQTSIDSQATGDTRSLKQFGSHMGFFTEITFVSNIEIACGASRGLVLFYAVGNGKLTCSIDLHTDASVLSLALSKDGTTLCVVLSDGKLAFIPGDTG